MAQLFSCEFCEIVKNTFLQNTFGRLLLKKNNKAFLFSILRLFHYLLTLTFIKLKDFSCLVSTILPLRPRDKPEIVKSNLSDFLE